MKKKIKEIRIQNFKIFNEAELINFDGKNALIYGNNGSGKSSLYWALYTFLQSSIKTKPQVQKYFLKNGKESLLNVFNENNLEGYLKLVTIDENKKEDGYLISYDEMNTNCPEIKEANLASDFLNYRLLLRFYYFRHSEPINLFSVFVKEFFPFWTDSKYGVYDDWFFKIKDEQPYINVGGQQRKAGKSYSVYKNYQRQITTFNSELDKKINDITLLATKFYADHFFPEDKLEILLNYDQQIQFDNKNWAINEPSLSLKLKFRDKDIERPQSFLNESRLTAVALSIKFAALKNRLHDADLKFLVLDDLLISLDMSNRTNIINIILSEFSDYQILILTHDKGFYEILKNNLIADDDEWKCFEFYENNNDSSYNNPIIRDGKDYLVKAAEYLKNKQYEECALCLRKKAEELIRIYYDPSLEHLSRFSVLENLCNSLKNSVIRKEQLTKSLNSFSKILDSSLLDINYLHSIELSKFSYDASLSSDENKKNIEFKKLIGHLKNHFKNKSQKNDELNELISKAKNIDELRSRVLNIGAHHTHTPVFEKELSDAIMELEVFQSKVLKIVK